MHYVVKKLVNKRRAKQKRQLKHTETIQIKQIINHLVLEF